MPAYESYPDAPADTRRPAAAAAAAAGTGEKQSFDHNLVLKESDDLMRSLFFSIVQETSGTA